MKVAGFFISTCLAFLLLGKYTTNNSEKQYATSLPLKEKWGEKVASAAESIIDSDIVYDPAYVRIPFPNGDVDPKTGVCTDVVIRTYRKLNIDLQELVHEDMKKNFQEYPNNWGLISTDKNIDHRRVPNLTTFFKRHGKAKAITKNAQDYSAGDIVTWNLGNGILHIGIVSNREENGSPRKKVIHNIGNGQVSEDILFNWTITGHFSY